MPNTGTPGDDTLYTSNAPDTVDGGDGYDVWQADYSGWGSYVAFEQNGTDFALRGYDTNGDFVVLTTVTRVEEIHFHAPSFGSADISLFSGTSLVSVDGPAATVGLTVDWSDLTTAITGTATYDVNNFDAGSFGSISAAGQEVDWGDVSHLQLSFGSANDSYSDDNRASLTLYAGAGDDTISTGSWSESVYGGEGDDSLISAGANHGDVYGGGGADTAGFLGKLTQGYFSDSLNFHVVHVNDGSDIGFEVFGNGIDVSIGKDVEYLTFTDRYDTGAVIAVDLAGDTSPAVITSAGGGDAGTVRIVEHHTLVATVQATSSHPTAYVIAGGADAAQFHIDTLTGALSFLTAPDVDAPADANGDNLYDVQVRAANLFGSDVQDLTVEVLREPNVLGIGGVTVAEGDGGTRYATVVIERAGGDDALTVDYTTANGSAVAGVDYSAVSGTASFAAGATTVAIQIPILGDTTPEAGKSFTVTLSGAAGPHGAAIGDGVAEVVILDDDTPVSGAEPVGAAVGVGETNAAFVFSPSMAATGSGFVMVWMNDLSLGDPADQTRIVKGQLFDQSGAPVGGAFVVASTPGGQDGDPSVTRSGDGFLVTWSHVHQSSGSTVADIQGQLYSAEGVPIGETFVVSPHAPDASGALRVSDDIVRLTNGDYAVAWAGLNENGSADDSGFAVNAAVIEAQGDTVAPQFQVNTSTHNSQSDAKAAALANGGFVVVFNDYGAQYPAAGQPVEEIKAQIYDASGLRVGGELALASGANPQFSGAAAGLADGGFVAVWVESDQAGGAVAHAQRFDDLGGKVGGVIDIDPTSTSAAEITVEALPEGGFVAAWSNYDGSGHGNYNIHAQVFAADGSAAGSSFLVSDAADNNGSEQSPTIAILADGDFAVGWRAYDTVTYDMSAQSRVYSLSHGTVTPPPAPGVVSVADASGAEGTAATAGALQIAVTRSGGVDAFTVNYAVAGGTATVGSDFTAGSSALSGTLTFAAGQMVAYIDLQVIRDAVVEPSETLTVTLSSPTSNATIGSGLATYTILNDDTVTGGHPGDDIYYVNDPAYVIDELPNGGTDTVKTTVSYTLPANVENMILLNSGLTGRGNDLANRLSGTAGADTLDGGHNTGGAGDTLQGGAGDDAFYVRNANDVVFDPTGGGTDTIYTDLPSFSLAAAYNVENLTYVGSGTFSGVGDGRDNVVTGGAGNDILDGGNGGADTLVGGRGNDVYHVTVGDHVVELAGGGHDTVETGLSRYTLDANVEDLRYTGIGAFSAAGNAEDNLLDAGASGVATLRGGAGDDTLMGGSGPDKLYGGAGADVVYGGGGDDWVRSLTGEGPDTVHGGAGTDLLTMDRADATVALHVDLTLTGLQTVGEGSVFDGFELIHFKAGSGADYLRGGGLDDVLKGNAGDDTLIGGAGADTLDGGPGDDSLTGGPGADVFRFDSPMTGFDTVTDFQTGSDKVALSHTGFGVLALSDFDIVTAQTGVFEAKATLVVDTVGHTLAWDADGTGAGSAVTFAHGDFTTSANDYFVF